MSHYHIVDEPKGSQLDKLVVNPIIILFAAIFIPIFITLPFDGRWWMPFAWLAINGYLLGSPTLKNEILISILGVLSLYGLLEIFILLSQQDFFSGMKSFVQYVRIILNGVLFLTMYLVVFKQSVPYEIFTYMRGK